jgi:hypothetical protein
MVLPGPSHLSAEFAALNGQVILGRLDDFAEPYLVMSSQRTRLDETLQHAFADIRELFTRHLEFNLLDHLAWRIEFFDVYANGSVQPPTTFAALVGILRPVLEQQAELSNFIVQRGEGQHGLAPLPYDDVHNGIAYVIGLEVEEGKAFNGKSVDVKALYRNDQGPQYFSPEKWVSLDWVKAIVEDFKPSDQNKENEVTEAQTPQQEQAPENTGKKPVQYYTRHGLSALLQDTADPADLMNVEKFIDDQLAAWSRHLALNTHQKQTNDTPRFSINEGPGIVTIMLDRSDLAFGERAPQLQMIFSDGEHGLAITPRIEGGMTTSRMLDSFDQVLLELNAGKRVPFTQLDQLVTFIDHVSDHNDAAAFRVALGNPHQALVEAGMKDFKLVMYMTRLENSNKIDVMGMLIRENMEDEELFQIWLDDIGHQGQLMVKVSEESVKVPTVLKNQGEAEDLSKSEGTREQLAPVWEEVRETRADPDSVLERHPPVSEERLREAVAHASKIDGFYVQGRDQHMLKHVLNRFRNEGNLNNLDLMALDAAERFIFTGGVINLPNWSYEAALIVGDRGENEERLLHGDSNAYVVICVDDRHVPTLVFQCKVNQQEQQ